MTINRAAFDLAAKYCVFSLLFFIPLSKPLVNISFGVLLLMMPFLSNIRERLTAEVKRPIFIACAALFLTYVVSALRADLHVGAQLWAYRTIPGMLLVAIALQSDSDRLGAWRYFAGGVIVAALGALLVGFGLLEKASGSAIGQFTFSKNYVQQGLMSMLTSVFLFALAQIEDRRGVRQVLYGAALLLFIFVFTLLEARTVWTLAMVLIPLLAIRVYGGSKGLLYGLAAILCFAALGWQSPLVKARISTTLGEIPVILSQEAVGSLGIRAELARAAVRVVADAPILGQGMDGWHASVERQHFANEGTKEILLKLNPHSDPLFIWIEQGLAGLVAYLALGITVIVLARREKTPWDIVYLALIIIYFGAGVFNTLFADFTHRHALFVLLACAPASFSWNRQWTR